MATIKWMTVDQKPPAKERLLLIVSAAGQPPDVKLIGKSEVKIGFWTGDAFRLMDSGEQPIVIGSPWPLCFLPMSTSFINVDLATTSASDGIVDEA
ncbi:hypothetical protein [Bradyrhizobium sp. Ash2021]|uniref:hypothetical protein n=1 Tax=Bradyrhizobium sp. Ash2021 TaxID=2954771 RepID=UPI0028167B94|nr:hypothetical protein [Bradyrhizobium sp. Ash2021]WMT78762.1 hypothetical protein NL528_21530 [Bradyrhizobium sp. Ash2021]